MAIPREKDDPSVVAMVDLPVIDTPFTRICETWFTTQGSQCGDLEMDYMRCAGRVGYRNIEKTICQKYLEDWMECAFKINAGKRYYAMQAERKKKGIGFEKPPPPDSIVTSF